MEKEFIPYNLAVKLKELEFDEPCIAYYVDGEDRFVYDIYTVNNFSGRNILIGKAIATPLWQQIFDWFRDQYGLHTEIRSYTAERFTFVIQELKNTVKYIEYGGINNAFKTYQEARKACLEKLIELCKKN